MINPAYNDIPAKRIPKVSFNGGYIKIIAGNYQGKKGPGKPHTDMFYHDIYLQPNIDFEIFIENGWNAFIYVYEGSVIIDQNIYKTQMAILEQTGNLKLNAGKNGAQYILVAGEPLNEPVARGGPFVMNTKGEVLQAFTDYHNGVLDK